jgi:spoIIIJ-associated protein
MTIQDFISNLCQHAGLESDQIDVAIDEQESIIKVQLTVPEPETGLFIGFRGETLDSIQRLVRVVFHKDYPDSKIVVHVNDYREQRQQRLAEMANNAAERVITTGQTYHFPALPPHERFVIHSTITENPDYSNLDSTSEGEGRDRHVVLKPKV